MILFANRILAGLIKLAHGTLEKKEPESRDWFSYKRWTFVTEPQDERIMTRETAMLSIAKEHGRLSANSRIQEEARNALPSGAFSEPRPC